MTLLLDSPVCVSNSVPSARIRFHKHALGLVGAVVAAVAPASIAIAGADPDGFLFTSPDGAYSVVFPAEPATVGEQMGGFGGAIEIFGTVTAAGFLMTAQTDVPPGGADDLDLASDEVLDAMGIDAGEVAPITLRGVPGVEFTGPLDEVVDGGSVHGRLFVTDDTAYLAVVMGFESEVRMDAAVIATFFDSFDFMKEAF